MYRYSQKSTALKEIEDNLDTKLFNQLKKLLKGKDEDEIELVRDFLLEDFSDEDLELVIEVAEDSGDDIMELIEEYKPYPKFAYGDAYKIGNYILYKTEEDAIEAAKEDIQASLDEMGLELFNESFVMSHIDEEAAERFFRDVYNEWNYSYAEDIRSERASDDEYDNRLEEEMAEAGVSDIDEFVEWMTDQQIEEGGGGYDHFASNFGDAEAKKLLVENNLIDVDSLIEEAINVDGWAHTLSRYDGNYSELPSGAVYFRES